MAVGLAVEKKGNDQIEAVSKSLAAEDNLFVYSLAPFSLLFCLQSHADVPFSIWLSILLLFFPLPFFSPCSRQAQLSVCGWCVFISLAHQIRTISN